MAKISLTPEQRRALIASEKAINDAATECARAKKVGIDCTEAEKVVEEARRLRSALLQEYGTTRT